MMYAKLYAYQLIECSIDKQAELIYFAPCYQESNPEQQRQRQFCIIIK